MVTIAFIHPDLGIGGAERLVVDAACGLQDLGNTVVAYTSHCDRLHCFEEVKSNELLVVVYGDWLPTTIARRFHIVCAGLRQLWLTGRLLLAGPKYDFYVVDQLSYCIPLLKIFGQDRVMFYGHFPDQLLALPGSPLKRLYRLPFDWFEEWTTGWADKVVVNLNFTRGVFTKTFSQVGQLEVIYPCINEADAEAEDLADFFKLDIYLLINRFERKKNIELAIRAFATFRKTEPRRVRLVCAGGWDARVMENVQYLNELTQLCEELKLTLFTIRGKLAVLPPLTDVLFLPLISLSVKNGLIKHAQLLLYTPSNEHFGIVPVELMLHRTPVLACNNGGPLELVVHFNGEDNLDVATGFNVEPTPELWAKTLTAYANYPAAVRQKLGDNGYDRATSVFSRREMAKAFARELELTKLKSMAVQTALLFALLVAVLAVAVYILQYIG